MKCTQYESQVLAPFLVGASWTDSVMSFWLAGRIGLSDSACFLFISLLNCLRSAQVRNFLTVTCSKSKHFSRYRRNSSSSARKFQDVRWCLLLQQTNKQTNKENRTFQKSLLVWEAIYLWTHPCTPPLWLWPALRLLVQSHRVEPLYFGCCCQWYLLHPDLHQGDWRVAWHPGPQL